MRFLKKHAYTLLFSTALLSANVYVLLKTFVIPSAVTKVAAETSSTTASTETGEVTTTDTSYQDDNISIIITTGNTSNTTYYVADITLSSTDYLKTALAQDTLGTNITETTSSIASSKNAFLPLTVTITALIRQVM